MKKILLTFLFCLVATLVYAAPTWIPTAYSGDQVVSTGRTVIVDANIYWSGLTVGDKVQLRNGLTTSATPFLTYVVPTANGTFYYPERQRNLVVDTGVYLDQTISGGTLGVELKIQ